MRVRHAYAQLLLDGRDGRSCTAPHSHYGRRSSKTRVRASPAVGRRTKRRRGVLSLMLMKVSIVNSLHEAPSRERRFRQRRWLVASWLPPVAYQRPFVDTDSVIALSVPSFEALTRKRLSTPFFPSIHTTVSPALVTDESIHEPTRKSGRGPAVNNPDAHP